MGLIKMSTFLRESLGDEKWVIKDFMPEVGVTFLAASPKSGKSTVVRQMMACVSTGSPFWGRETTRGRILYLVCDEDERDVWEHGQAVDKAYPGWGERIDCAFMRGSDRETIWNMLMQAITDARGEKEPYSLVVLDTFADVIDPGVDLNQYQQTREALRKVTKLTQDHQLHVVCLHHVNKRGEFSGSLVDMMGSQGNRSITNMNMLLYKDEESGQRYITSEVRRGMPIVNREFHYDPETKLVELGSAVFR